jgi:hypothetical protein
MSFFSTKDLVRLQFDPTIQLPPSMNNGIQIPFKMQGIYDKNNLFKTKSYKNDNLFQMFISGEHYVLSGSNLVSPVTDEIKYSNKRPLLFEVEPMAALEQMNNSKITVKIMEIQPEENGYSIYVQLADNAEKQRYKNLEANGRGGGRRAKRSCRMKRKSRFRRSRRF